jgi:hypothetical protein
MRCVPERRPRRDQAAQVGATRDDLSVEFDRTYGSQASELTCVFWLDA